MAPELLGVEDEELQEQSSMTGGATCSVHPCHIIACSVTLESKDSTHCSKGFLGLVLRVC